MMRIEMGTIVDGYEAAMITEGFDIGNTVEIY